MKKGLPSDVVPITVDSWKYQMYAAIPQWAEGQFPWLELGVDVFTVFYNSENMIIYSGAFDALPLSVIFQQLNPFLFLLLKNCPFYF